MDTLAHRAALGAADPMVSIRGLTKTYKSGFTALAGVDLEVRRGEIFALLGPNGAGKTTMIKIICGISNATAGAILVDGFDTKKSYRETRSRIGLVPQELTSDLFETVWNTVKFSRGLFGKAPNPAYLEKILKDLTLWDKKDSRIIALSGGMKRRVMIAKALAHEPTVLFLDEPTAGVDVELRRDMWKMVHELRASGVTIILTTHYIEEAEEMADRVGVINHGKIILVEKKADLMRKLGRKQLVFMLAKPLAEVPGELSDYELILSEGGSKITYTYDTKQAGTTVSLLLRKMTDCGVEFRDLQTAESSLEEIFVELVGGKA